MPFRYSSYISYRRTNQTIVDRFVEELHSSLSSELAAFLDLPIFYDKERLEPGQRFSEVLEEALCESVCMLVVFTPTYFTSLYTAREYRGMELLEKRRLMALPSTERESGLIIPLVLRGADYMPQELTNRRLLYNFDRFLVGDARVYRSPGFRRSMAEIAEYIFRRHQVLGKLKQDLCAECRTFRLPSEADTQKWLIDFLHSQRPFPRLARDNHG